MAASDYDLPKLSGVISMTKLRNQFKRVNPDLVFNLHNIKVNGQALGCSGFITNPATGKIAYVRLEKDGMGLSNAHTGGEALYRTATSTRDYSGGMNNFTSYDEVVPAVIELINKVD